MKTRRTAYDQAYPPEPPPVVRHTLSGAPGIEDQIQQDLARLAADAELSVLGPVESLNLVGRFARGEGSAIKISRDTLAYCGYHCLAVLDHDSPAAAELLADMERTWSGHLRVPLRIHSVNKDRLSAPQAKLWWMDICAGHFEPLSGDSNSLAAIPSVSASDLDPSEAGWLLTEQATLLALSQLKAPLDSDRVTHRIHTLALACGDAALLLAKRYEGDMRTRLEHLSDIAPETQQRCVAEALTFLARPDLWKAPSPDWHVHRLTLLRNWHLRLEQQRLGTPTDLRSFVRHRQPMFPKPNPGGMFQAGLQLVKSLVESPPAFPYIAGPLERLTRISAGLAYGKQDAGARLMCARLLGLDHIPDVDSRGELQNAVQDLFRTARADRADLLDIDFYV